MLYKLCSTHTHKIQAQNSNKPNTNANLIPIHTQLSVQLEIAVRLSLPDQAWTTMYCALQHNTIIKYL